MFGQVSNERIENSLKNGALNVVVQAVSFNFSIISEIVETTILEKRDDAKDESVEAVFQSILRQKNLDVRDKKAAIVDFIAAGIHTVLYYTIFTLYSSSNRRVRIFSYLFSPSFYDLSPTAWKYFGVSLRFDWA